MKSFSPSHKVIVRALRNGQQEEYDITKDVLSVHTNKAYGRASGGWQIILTSRMVSGTRRWSDILIPNDIIEITMSRGRSGDRPVRVFKGLIDRASLSVAATAEGQLQRTVKICGQDMGKLLLTGEIGWDISPTKFTISSTDSYWATFMKRMTLTSGTPPKLISEIMDIMGLEVPLIGQEIEWYEWNTSDDNWTTFNKEAYLIERSTIWAAMKRYENDPWNVLFTDTDDSGKFHVGFERQPLDIDGRVVRGSDKTYTLSRDLLISADLGVSDAERINLITLQTPVLSFVTGGQGLDLALTQKDCTRYDEASITRNGYIPHEFKTDFWPPEFTDGTSKSGQQAVTSAVKPRVDVMWEWVKRNHEYSAGIMTVKGDPRIRAGWKLIDESTGMSYLIEQVSHEYSVHPLPRFITTLQVTRGQRWQAGASTGLGH